DRVRHDSWPPVQMPGPRPDSAPGSAPRQAGMWDDFAMPETGIGFVPDVGSSHFLSRCPGEAGLYLALTGARIGLADARTLGLVTHAVERADFAAVMDGLSKGQAVEDAIAPHVRKAGPGALAPHRRRIDTIFAAASVEAIMERLDRDGSDFAQATAQVIRTRSPQSLKIVFRQIRTAAKLSLRACLAMEFRLATRMLASHDFREGVRAALVDKDRSPKWQPASLAGVGDVDAFFAPLDGQELF
ncbi:MAG: enoyl-CoA hydratase/isomerase family protein, partial [Rhizomicrobium sp.]